MSAEELTGTQPPDMQPPVAPEPEFQVLGAHARRYAAMPAIEFDVHVSETSGRQVYAIGLSAQVMIEPARREYDADTRRKLVELFGTPERWGTTTRSLVWHQAETLVPSFIGSTTFRMSVPCTYDLEIVATKYFYALDGGEVPLAFNFNGTVYYRGDDGRIQMALVPWSCTVGYRFDVSIWRELMEEHYPGTGWVVLRSDTIEALLAEKAKRALPTIDACVAELLEEQQ